jgi:cellobiose phosphorylase
MYRLLIETLLGVNLEDNQLRLSPRLPKKWNTLMIHYRHRQTHYRIRVTRVTGAPFDGNRLSLDGQALPGCTIPLVDDGRDHSADLQVG